MGFEMWFTASISVAQNSFSIHHPSSWLLGVKGPFWEVVSASEVSVNEIATILSLSELSGSPGLCELCG